MLFDELTEALTVGAIGGSPGLSMRTPSVRFPPQPPQRVPEDYRKVFRQLLNMGNASIPAEDVKVLGGEAPSCVEATSTGGGGYSGARPLGAPLRDTSPEPIVLVPVDYMRVIGSLVDLGEGELDEETLREVAWIKKAVKRPGRLRKHFGIPEGEPLPEKLLQREIKRLRGIAEKSVKELSMLRALNLAMTLKRLRR